MLILVKSTSLKYNLHTLNCMDSRCPVGWVLTNVHTHVPSTTVKNISITLESSFPLLCCHQSWPTRTQPRPQESTDFYHKRVVLLSRTSYKWNEKVCTVCGWLLYSAEFLWDPSILLCISELCSFFLRSVHLFGYTTICSPVDGLRVVSNLRLLQTKWFWTFHAQAFS